MAKTRFLHYLKLALGAIFLLNFSTICIICFSAVFGPIISGGGFFQNFILGMMFKEVTSSGIITAVRIFLFLSSIYLWFKRQNWLTAAYLIIAGTGAGLLYVYFFAFYYLSIFGCLAVILFCFCASLCLKFLMRFMMDARIQNLIHTLKKFLTPWKVAIACVICILILIERFIPSEFPILGKPLPYVVTGFGWTGLLPQHEYNISIAINVSRVSPRSADIAATCAASGRYFTENYGFPALRISIYDYLDEIGGEDKCYYLLGQCRYSPNGFYIHDKDKDLKPGWSNFRVARDIPENEIKECNRLKSEVDKKTIDIQERDKIIMKEMGYWAYSKLEPDLMDVKYELLPKDLCEKPEIDGKWSFPISRSKLIEECEALFDELKLIGRRPDFQLCYEHGCEDKAYKTWARRKYILWRNRAGNFAPEIISFNTSLNALAAAYSRNENERITTLTAKLDNILNGLKKFTPCGNR